jgi:FlaA1/EpsC-like NDP-sugar epimerase
MGASKRVCELIIQARAKARLSITYSGVRFGNVLGSSGSVVPLFRRQIEKGGPVTVTHADVTRYFMTIPEASQLVIQAGSMAEDGDIFLLDMGEPVRVRDLANAMIELSGLSVRDESNQDGDVEIIEIGLRPGEKLHEELLIEQDALPTSHPRIVRAHAPMIDWLHLQKRLHELSEAIEDFDLDRVMALVRLLVPNYRAVSERTETASQPTSCPDLNVSVH